MILKQRFIPEALRLMRYLKKRMDLTESDLNTLYTLEKGYEGEVIFDKWIAENLIRDCIILNDLLLKSNNTVFQIDSLIIFAEIIYLFEVKNFEGDFYIEDHKWHAANGKKIKNPLQQLERCEHLLHLLLEDLGIQASIQSHVCFVNHDFHLYNAPRNQSLIFPNQLSRFMKKLNMSTSKINNGHMKIAEKIVAAHLTNSPFRRQNVPEYSYETLRKGITCMMCHSFLKGDKMEDFLTCSHCRKKENARSAILRSAQEYNLLFPERKISTANIYDWCDGVKPKRSIRRALQEKYSLVGNNRYSYFVEHESRS